MRPGIYFGLPEDIYHNDEALGSNDLKLVRKDPAQFWLKSKMNPKRHLYATQTKSTTLGSAMHKMVLEGHEAFVRTYVRRVDDDEGMTPAQKAAVTKAAKKDLREDQTLLKADEFDLCLDTESIVTSHPDLKGALTGGASEVSVFWEGPGGVPLKARFDRLKPGGIGDLKSIANERDDKLETACKFAIKRYRYYMQAAHYLEGLAQLPRFVTDGTIFAWDRFANRSVLADGASTSLVNMCVERQKKDPPGFQFIFVQTSGAPATWACTLHPPNPILDIGARQVEDAIEIYLAHKKRFGTSQWLPTWRMAELDMSEMPGGEFGWE